ncbi:unnamed protein product [Cylicocyclus nassatus]|uniref:Uncharacterized protein n=1 Tax=Cylicocyclus nassatus TaxID=53992 RepID=A0AA36H6U7_CYLNA|nr:unnamed protein product [Cylicocyclus nassatus]
MLSFVQKHLQSLLKVYNKNAVHDTFRQFTQAFIKLYKRLVSTQEAEKPMRLYIFLFLVQTETVLSKQKIEQCVNLDYTYYLHRYRCPHFGERDGDGAFASSGSYATLVNDYLHGSLNMTPSYPLKHVACALNNQVKIPKGCGFTYFTVTYKSRQDLQRFADAIKNEMEEATKAHRKRGETIYFFLGCANAGNSKVTCAAYYVNAKKRNKEKCSTQKTGRKAPEQEESRVPPPTAGAESVALAPPSAEREPPKHSLPINSPGDRESVRTPPKEEESLEKGPSGGITEENGQLGLRSPTGPEESGPLNQSLPARPPEEGELDQQSPLTGSLGIETGSHYSSPTEKGEPGEPDSEMHKAGGPTPVIKDKGENHQGLNGGISTEAL